MDIIINNFDNRSLMNQVSPNKLNFLDYKRNNIKSLQILNSTFVETGYLSTVLLKQYDRTSGIEKIYFNNVSTFNMNDLFKYAIFEVGSNSLRFLHIQNVDNYIGTISCLLSIMLQNPKLPLEELVIVGFDYVTPRLQ